jgi:hypothetical protein
MINMAPFKRTSQSPLRPQGSPSSVNGGTPPTPQPQQGQPGGPQGPQGMAPNQPPPAPGAPGAGMTLVQPGAQSQMRSMVMPPQPSRQPAVPPAPPIAHAPPRPPTVPGQAVPPVPGATPINPANDLRGKNILPTGPGPIGVSGTDVRGLFDKLKGAGENVAITDSQRLAGRATGADAALQGVAAVDRFKLAQDKFNEFAESTKGAYEADNRNVLRSNAARGRMGSGMLRTDFGNLDLARGRDLDLQRKQVFNEALEGSIDDSFRKADTLQGAEQELAQREAARRGEIRDTKRDDVALAGDKLGVAADLYGSDVAKGRADRGEIRGERDHEMTLEQQAHNRRRQGMLDKEMLTEGQFGRDARRLTAGEAGNPGKDEINVAGTRREDLNNSLASIAQLFQQTGARAGGAGGTVQATAGAPAAPQGGGGVLGGLGSLFGSIFGRKGGQGAPAAAPAAAPVQQGQPVPEDEGPPVQIGTNPDGSPRYNPPAARAGALRPQDLQAMLRPFQGRI